MDEKLLAELKELQANLEGKTATEIKAAFDAFEEKSAAASTEIKSFIETEIKEMQDQFNQLAAAQKEVKASQAGPKDELKEAIVGNFDEIKTVRKGNAVNLELKVAGDMTLAASLTGDQPRVYRDGIVMMPKDAVNFADLVTSVNIDGGTYTFPQESGSDGGIAIQVEGSDKSQVDYDITMVDVNTDFLAGYCVYSKKMANNLPFLESFLPMAMRRDYFKAENSLFYADLAAAATDSTLIAGNHVERLIEHQMALMGLGYNPNIAVVNPADYGAILVTAGTDGTGQYSLPGVVTITNGIVSLNGVAIIPASWVPADKYIIGDWTYAQKVSTQGLGVEFSNEDADNFRKNNITARVEAQVALAILNGAAFIDGDFTTVV